jgi:hypothetical protein
MMVKPMKDDKSKLPSSVGASVDERLGNVLSAGLLEAETDECVDAEVIASLVDGALPADNQERDKVMKHLSSCDTCYEIYKLTADLLAEEERKEEKSNIIRLRFKPLALAATILIAVVAMYLFFKVDEIPKTAEQLVKMSEPKKEAYYRQPAPAAPGEKKSAPPPAVISEEKVKDNVEAKALEKGGKGSYEAEGEKRLRAVQPKKGGPKLEKEKTVPVTVPVEEKVDIPGERREERAEKETKTIGRKVYGPKRKPTRVTETASKPPEVASVNIIKQPLGFDSGSYRLYHLRDRFLAYKSHIPANELTLLFRETFKLTGQLKETFKRLRKEAVKTGDFKPMENMAQRAAAAPMVTLVKGEDTVYIYPNMGYFLSKSIPGSAEYRFFSLAAAGWCDTDGVCYSYGPGRAGIGPKSSLKERDTREKKIEAAGQRDKIIDPQEKKKRLAKWETLYPGLKGIYREIAFHTINHLKTFKE